MAEKSVKGPLPTLAKSWERTLRADGKSPYTIRNYRKSLRLLGEYLGENDLSDAVKKVKADDITDWLADVAEDTSASTAAHHYRNVVAFWAWVVKAERLLPPGKNPMLEVRPPRADDVKRPPLSQDQVAALLKSCSTTNFLDLRDAAIIRVLADTGMRLSGLIGLKYHPDHPGLDNPGYSDVFLDHQPPLLRLRLKGGRQHLVDIGRRTEIALDRYLRYRATRRNADDPQLWLSRAGVLTRGGLQQMLHRRSAQAGLGERVHPHRFRRSMATWHLDAGGSRDALMARAGWTSEKMVNLYVSDSRDRLAWQESQRLGVADRF
ncbi:tyrosine-type recombinase/integrase [Nocardiopsis dassonvillei]|uniref:tyrosine-type recombinase/integrase n=1 Tax=Nocardiopsis dassonvillei TaxID=2014 RepID=UPI003641DF8F